MRSSLIAVGAAALLGASATAISETREVDSVSHFVVTQDGDPYETPAGEEGVYGEIMHATQIEADGRTSSQWCVGEVSLSGDNGGVGMAGYCTIIHDNGDALFTSYIGPGGGQPSQWTVMGGTGEFAGATGSGTSTTVSQRGDGEAWTVKHTGTLTTK